MQRGFFLALGYAKSLIKEQVTMRDVDIGEGKSRLDPGVRGDSIEVGFDAFLEQYYCCCGLGFRTIAHKLLKISQGLCHARLSKGQHEIDLKRTGL